MTRYFFSHLFHITQLNCGKVKYSACVFRYLVTLNLYSRGGNHLVFPCHPLFFISIGEIVKRIVGRKYEENYVHLEIREMNFKNNIVLSKD